MARYIDDNIIIGVNLGLMAIMLLPISAMLCASFWLARRSKDPARVAFTYLKVTLTLAFLYVQSLAQRKRNSRPPGCSVRWSRSRLHF